MMQLCTLQHLKFATNFYFETCAGRSFNCWKGSCCFLTSGAVNSLGLVCELLAAAAFVLPVILSQTAVLQQIEADMWDRIADRLPAAD